MKHNANYINIDELFRFLKLHRIYNYEVQRESYNQFIAPYKNTTERVVSLLYKIVNTQSQPKIDNLSVFYQAVFKNIDKLSSFKKFVDFINPQNEKKYNYSSLFEGLRKQNGWGDKTSALFVKSVYHINSEEYGQELKFWDDCPSKIENSDDFFLPVDSVIIAIFKKIIPNPNKTWNFKNINHFLKEHYSNSEIEIWDDLWFWGFITQKGTGNYRSFEWNLNKYWTLQETDKDEKSIQEIKEKAQKFINIITT